MHKHKMKFLSRVEDEEPFDPYYAFVCRECGGHTTISKKQFWSW